MVIGVVLLAVVSTFGLAAFTSGAGTARTPGRLDAPAVSFGPDSAASGPRLIVNVQASDSEEVDYVLSSIVGYLRSGDTIDLTHDPSNPITSGNLATLNAEAREFEGAAPSGVTFSVHSGYLSQEGILANGTSPPITALVATLEPDGATPKLSYNFSAALSYLEQVNALAHARGETSVAYPTSSFLMDGNLESYHWNYGQIEATTDEMWVEMQGYATQALDQPSVWTEAVDKLVSEVKGAGQPLSKLAIQLILGETPGLLGVDPATAVADVEAAEAAGVSAIDLWAEPGYESYLGTTVAELREGSGSSSPTYPVSFTENGLPQGTPWSVTLNGTEQSGTRSTLAFEVENGTYGFTVGSVAGYRAEPTSSTVTVAGSSASVAVTFQAETEPIYAVVFTETGLAKGTEWTVTLNGTEKTGTGRTITFEEGNGTYGYSEESPVSGGWGTRYVAEGSGGTVTVSGGNETEGLEYGTEYELEEEASPSGSGSVSPGSGWYGSGAAVELVASGGSGERFVSWEGEGGGSYSGEANPENVTMEGPMNETATFTGSSDSNPMPRLSLLALGLPPGTNWSAVVVGEDWATTGTTNGTTITVTVTSGWVEYEVESPVFGGPEVRYVAEPSSGSVNVSGGETNVTVRFEEEAEVAVTMEGGGTVTVTPSASGWQAYGTEVEIEARASAGSAFVGWMGSGNGSYSGPLNPVGIEVKGPVEEVAEFGVGRSVGSGGSGGGGEGGGALTAWAASPAEMLGAIAGLVVGMNLLVRVVQRRRRKP